MKDIPAGSIDMILCDLPYGMLSKQNPNTKWDAQLDLQQLWKQYRRIIKKNGCICLFGSGAFTAALIMSNPRMYRYNLVWDKVQKTGFLNANRMPLRQHEDIVVFYKRLPTYNPQMEKCDPTRRNHKRVSWKGRHKITAMPIILNCRPSLQTRNSQQALSGFHGSTV